MNIKHLHAFLFILLSVFSASVMAQISSLNPESIFSEDVDHLGKVPGLLKWSGVEGAAHYEVFVSRQTTFIKTEKFKIEGKTRFHIRVYPNIDYFWKIKAYNINGEEVSTSSEVGFKYRVNFTGLNALPNGIAVDTDEVGVTAVAEVETPVEKIVPVDDVFKKHKVWLSTELGPLSYMQKSFILGNLDFEGFVFPTYGITYQSKKFFQKLYVEAMIHTMRSDFELKKPGAVLTDNNFEWSKYALNSFYNVSTWQSGDRYLELHLNLGIEKAETQIFDISNPGSIDLKSLNQTQLQLGLELRSHIYEGWTYFARGAYFVPLSTNGPYTDISIDSQTAVDVQVGTMYYFKENSFLGASLKGYFYKYKDKINDSSLGSFSSEREVNVYSTEVRAGFSF